MRVNVKNTLFASATIFSLVGAGTLAVASADAATTNRLPRYTLRAAHLTAEAEVLGTTPSNLEATLKTETMKQVLADKNLTTTEFRSQVKAQLTKDLEAEGYTSDQVTKALNHSAERKAKKA